MAPHTMQLCAFLKRDRVLLPLDKAAKAGTAATVHLVFWDVAWSYTALQFLIVQSSS